MILKIVLVFALTLSSLLAAPKGGSFKINLTQSPTTLNPLSSTDYYASQVQAYIIESLAERDVNTYEWKPLLAKSWEISKNGLVFTFKLRDGVTWHDGKPFTVEDVKFTFDAIMHPKNKYKTAHSKSYFENIEKAEVLDKSTIRFTAKKKYFGNFNVVAGMDVVPRHLFENPSKKQLKLLNKTLIGTGPYTLFKFKRGKGITLKANKKWWGRTSPTHGDENNFAKILLRFVKDTTIAIKRTEKGDLDYLPMGAEEYVKKATGPKWGKEVHKVKVTNQAPKGYGFIGWNFKTPIFKSKNTRKALYHLINRGQMIEKFRYGLALPATGPLYQQSFYANGKVKPIEYSPKIALKLLKADGWSDSDDDQILDKMIDGKKTKLSFTILEPRQDFVKYLTIFQEDAKKAGIDIKIKFVEWNTFIKLLDERKFDAVRLGWSGGSVDWDPKQIWHTDSAKNQGSNFISYSNPKVDKLIDESRVIMNREERAKKLREVYQNIAEDYPYAFFFNDKFGFYGHTNRMKRDKDTYSYSIGTSYWWITK